MNIQNKEFHMTHEKDFEEALLFLKELSGWQPFSEPTEGIAKGYGSHEIRLLIGAYNELLESNHYFTESIDEGVARLISRLRRIIDSLRDDASQLKQADKLYQEEKREKELYKLRADMLQARVEDLTAERDDYKKMYEQRSEIKQAAKP